MEFRRVPFRAKEHATAEKSYLKAVEQGNSKAADAHRQAEVQRARADALEDQLARLRDLPAALEATLRRSASPAKARKTTEKKVARSSTNRAKVSKTGVQRSEEHTSELQSLMRISYAVFCLKKKNENKI